MQMCYVLWTKDNGVLPRHYDATDSQLNTSWTYAYFVKKKCPKWKYNSQEILLHCDQSNVLLARIIFFCILLKAFLFLSACIKDPGV